MNLFRRWNLFVFFFGVTFLHGCSVMNDYQRSGEMQLSGLKAPVTVMRDEKGMAYIYAQDMYDGVMAQGFVAAQDRLFQMELTRLFASGRISEMIGEQGAEIDTRMRTIGFYRNAKKHAKLLDAETRLFFQKYLDGVNAFVETRQDSYHLEFKLAGIKPTPWTLADSLAIVYLMGWNSAANLDTEIITQMLVEKVGVNKAREIFPLNINPDDQRQVTAGFRSKPLEPVLLGLASDKKIKSYFNSRFLEVGSNNWVVGEHLSAGNMPIVANDVHLDTRILPGPWYPCGIIIPEFKAVGAGIPGIPGLVVGRTNYIAFGLGANAYGDAQDLFVETVDPNDANNYLEGQTSIPFEVLEETLNVKDKKARNGFRKETIKVKFTQRGPVISDVLPGLRANKLLTLRWSAFETMGPKIGLDRLFTAKSVKDLRESLKHTTCIMLNCVFADIEGNIGWLATGKLPIRTKGDGTLPFVVSDSEDNWSSWIPFEQMPQMTNPKRGWIGTCNHKTVTKDYPYYYSSRLSPSYRYRRLKQLLDTPEKKAADDHWQYQRDTLNLMAQQIAPIMAKALMVHDDTQKLGKILSDWDYHDKTDTPAPTIFQAVYRNFALMVFQDELGEELAKTMLKDWYFWQERLHKMVLENKSTWFDNLNTPGKTETRDELFHQAAGQAAKQIKASVGNNPKKWLWGKVHQLEFVSPIRRKGFGKGIVGGGSYSVPGSQETLCRGIYDFNDPFGVTISASLRMVADLSDNDKVLALIPGGICGRVFDSHATDQIKAFINGAKMYWWFSDEAIKAHCKHTLILNP
jgi:penicillin amidase